MKARSLFFVLMIAALMLTSCTPAAATPAPAAPAQPAAAADIKIALLAPLSGPVPTFGVSMRDGAMLAIDEWNAKGGVNGSKIVPIIEDSQCTPDPAVNAANKVIDQDKVHYIIGEVCSKASIPVSEIADAKGVVMISGSSTNPAVTIDKDGKAKPYIFRTCFIDDFQGTVGAKYALGTLKAKTAFVLIDQANDYVKGLAEFFEKSFTEGGGKIVGTESYTSKDTDFSAVLAKVADAKPDVIYLPDYYNIVNLAAKQAKEKGITAPFMGSDGWDSPDLDAKAADGGYFTNHFSAEDPRPEVQAFLKAFGEKYKDDKGQPKVPDAIAVLSYDSTNMMLQAIKDVGDDPAKVKDAVFKMKFAGISGLVTFDERHNPIKSAVILKVTEGKVKFDSVVNP